MISIGGSSHRYKDPGFGQPDLGGNEAGGRRHASAGAMSEHGISSATLYKWRARFGGMDISLMTRLKAQEAENARLKKRYAKERLKAEIVRDALEKIGTPSRRREMVYQAAKHRTRG